MPLTRRKKIVFAAALSALTLAICLVLYVGSVCWRSSAHLGKHVRWVGCPYQSDSQYGYFPKPHALAWHALREGDRIPVLFDEHGFRVPEASPTPQPPTGKSILFLGCSFTHGYGVAAEETFAQLAADGLQARCLNAGVSGWGLAQMVLRARKEIPRFRPQYVIVQSSDWLVSRSQELYGPTDLGAVPIPYFYYYAEQTSVGIHAPVFRPVVHDLLAQYSRETGLLSFTWNVGLPLYRHDDLAVSWVTLCQALGYIPAPAASRAEILQSAYAEIHELCVANGSQMLLLPLQRGWDEPPQDAVNSTKFPRIETFEPLAAALSERTQTAWSHAYYHWRGSPPRLVDMHPSPQAHAVVARAIINHIRTAQRQDSSRRPTVSAAGPQSSPE